MTSPVCIELHQIGVNGHIARLIAAPGVTQLILEAALDHQAVAICREIPMAGKFLFDWFVLLVSRRPIFAGVNLGVFYQPIAIHLQLAR